MRINDKTKNQLVIGLSFLTILFLLTFSLAKNFWQKKQDQKKTTEKNFEQDQKKETEKSPEKKFRLISPEEAEAEVGKESSLFIDLRSAVLFEDNHIETSRNLPSTELGSLTDAEKNKLIIIVDSAKDDSSTEKINELVTRGFQIAYLEGGFEKYQALGFSTVSFGYPDSPFDTAKTRPINAQALQERLLSGETFQFLDTREKSFFETSHISGSVNVPLEDLEKRKEEVPFGRIVIVDEEPLRAFQAAVRLFDMHFIDVLYLSDNLSMLKK